ncbi:PREDICTED: uncharacterized protein LOC108773927 [Cyphomyrmex costatus]|uniref:uncharacterized protein LOC108773927 n=1 Tax=Cyphomyrmex costatus TaxID=456900 RepID=UPI0008523D97|nr:PREDICTED: uncharacterized protein LOC108773927 [Cyphomyrmex costatus]
MSSFILSHDLHLMMLEIGVENKFWDMQQTSINLQDLLALIICDCKWSFVPWTTAFDKVILKKTIVIFRMLDNDWTSLSPNRHDSHPYQGSNYENEKFYDGSSVVFSMLTDFFEKKANGVNVQLYVRKQVYDGNVHFVRRELPEHRRHNFALHSDQLPRQMSHNGDHASQKYTRSILYSRRLDEKQPYFSRQLTSKELQSGCWDDDGLLRVSSGRLICCCEELVKKEVADLVKDVAAIKEELDNAIVDSTAMSVAKIADYGVLGKRTNGGTDVNRACKGV